MGKTKWYTETSPETPNTGYRSAYAVRHRPGSRAPGRLVDRDTESLSNLELLAQLWLRIRRKWIAFRFVFHRITLGVFQKQALLKAGLLGAMCFILLKPSRETGYYAEQSIFDPQKTDERIESESKGFGISIFGRKKKAAKPAAPANDAAPVSVRELRDPQTEKYIERYAPTARTEMSKYGIPASISLAQGLIESRAGTSKLAVQNNNHFGIKCFSRNCPKGHCTNHMDDSHKDFFRKFGTPWESWRQHSRMLASGRYASLKKHGRDYKRWAQGLERNGYATDPGYAEKLIGVIERYDLHRFDK